MAGGVEQLVQHEAHVTQGPCIPCSCLLLVVGEAAAERGQAVDQSGRLPVLAVALGQCVEALTNGRQTLTVGPVIGPPTSAGKP